MRVNNVEYGNVKRWSRGKDPGLVLYTPFSEGRGTVTKDYSEHGNNGTLEGGPRWVRGKFKFGSALNFITDDYVDCGVFLDTNENFSVNAQIYITETPTNNTKYIVTKGKISEYQFDFRINTSRQLELAIFTTTGASYLVATSSVLDLYTWYHVAGVYIKATSASVYVNGILDGIDIETFPTKETQLGAKVYIGDRETTAEDRSFTGTIDFARMYNRELNAQEAQFHVKHCPPLAAPHRYHNLAAGLRAITV